MLASTVGRPGIRANRPVWVKKECRPLSRVHDFRCGPHVTLCNCLGGYRWTRSAGEGHTSNDKLALMGTNCVGADHVGSGGVSKRPSESLREFSILGGLLQGFLRSPRKVPRLGTWTRRPLRSNSSQLSRHSP